MKFYSDRFITDKYFSYLYLKILSFNVMLTATAIFIYFFIAGNFHIHYIIIELLNELKQKEMKNTTNVLLA